MSYFVIVVAFGHVFRRSSPKSVHKVKKQMAIKTKLKVQIKKKKKVVHDVSRERPNTCSSTSQTSSSRTIRMSYLLRINNDDLNVLRLSFKLSHR